MRNSAVRLETIDEPVPNRPGLTRPRALVLNGIYVDRITVVGLKEPKLDGAGSGTDRIMPESPMWCDPMRQFETKHPGKLRLDRARSLVGIFTGRAFPRLEQLEGGCFGLGPCNATSVRRCGLSADRPPRCSCREDRATGNTKAEGAVWTLSWWRMSLYTGVLNADSVRGAEGERVTFQLY
ncbi:hypothetical protein RB595_008930 [Gaeumannomyces hyphopodioides]